MWELNWVRKNIGGDSGREVLGLEKAVHESRVARAIRRGIIDLIIGGKIGSLSGDRRSQLRALPLMIAPSLRAIIGVLRLVLRSLDLIKGGARCGATVV